MIKNELFTHGATQLNPEWHSYVVVGDVTLSDENDLISWKYEFISDSVFGGFPSAKLEVEYFSGLAKNYAGQEVKLFVGPVVNNQAVDELIGSFTVLNDGQTVDELKQTAKFIALDYATKADVKFDDSGITYPIALNDYMNEVYHQCGLECISTLPNLMTLDSAPNKNPNDSCRQIISHYAQLHFTVAMMNRDGKLVYRGIGSESDQVTITEFDFTDLQSDEKATPVGKLVISRLPQEDNYVEFGGEGVEYKLINNMFADCQRETLAPILLQKIIGYSHTAYDMKLYGRPELESNDYFIYNDIKHYVQNIEMTFNGGLLSRLWAKPLMETQTDYQIAGTKDTLYATMLAVDKAKQEIKATIEKADEDRQKLTEMIQDLDSVKLKISDGGGANILKNSVGYKGTEFWKVIGGTINTGPTTWNLDNGISKHGLQLGPGASTIEQSINLKANHDYCIRAIIKCGIDNAQRNIKLMYDDETGTTKQFDVIRVYEGQEYDGEVLNNFTTGNWTNCKIVVLQNSGIEIFEVTDLGIYEGQNFNSWQQNAGETYTLNVQVDETGLIVYSADKKSKTVMSPEEFSGYYDNKKVFTINGEITEVQGLMIKEKGLFVPPIRFVQSKERNCLVVVWTGFGG